MKNIAELFIRFAIKCELEVVKDWTNCERVNTWSCKRRREVLIQYVRDSIFDINKEKINYELHSG